MKIQKKIVISLLFVFLTSCGFMGPETPTPSPTNVPPTIIPTATSTKPIIRIVGDSWCPYNCAPDSDYPGYAIEISKEIFENAGYQFRYELTPWSRAVQGVMDGTYDGAIGATKGDIPEAIYPDNELGYSKNSLFIRKGFEWKYEGIDSLKQIHLGVVKNYFYSDEVNQYLDENQGSPQIDFLYNDDTVLMNLSKLTDKKIDVYIEDDNIVAFAINHNTMDSNLFDSVDTVGQVDPFYIAFSPQKENSVELAKILSDGIQEMRESGRLSQILKRYGLQDWQQVLPTPTPKSK